MDKIHFTRGASRINELRFKTSKWLKAKGRPLFRLKNRWMSPNVQFIGISTVMFDPM